MLDCIKFLLSFVSDIAKMLFSISVGNGLNFGIMLCIIFIFLPITLRIIKIIRMDAIDELNDKIEDYKLKRKKGKK